MVTCDNHAQTINYDNMVYNAFAMYTSLKAKHYHKIPSESLLISIITASLSHL